MEGGRGGDHEDMAWEGEDEWHGEEGEWEKGEWEEWGDEDFHYGGKGDRMNGKIARAEEEYHSMLDKFNILSATELTTENMVSIIKAHMKGMGDEEGHSRGRRGGSGMNKRQGEGKDYGESMGNQGMRHEGG
jgi:hypothetical protein